MLTDSLTLIDSDNEPPAERWKLHGGFDLAVDFRLVIYHEWIFE